LETVLIVWLFVVVVTGAVASGKGRSAVGWAALAVLFSCLALIAVALLPTRKATPVVAGGEVATPETHVRCPDCQELVLMAAKVCKHCHASLVPIPKPAPPPRSRIAMIAAAARDLTIRTKPPGL